MVISVFLAGLLLGSSIAAPIGPMALLCIGRCLDRGWRAGVVIGLGIATGDMLYGGIAAFGFSAVAVSVAQFAQPLRLAGGGFLVWLGVRALARQLSGGASLSEPQAATLPRAALASEYLMAIGLTLANPQTILSFIAAFAAIGVASNHGSTAEAVAVVAGVFTGSALWWLVLCGLVARLRHAVSDSLRRWIGAASSVILILLGLAAALGGFE